MRIYPINTDNNLNCKAIIKPTDSLKSGFEMMGKYADTNIMKDMNSVKDFVDSIARISESKKVHEFKIDIDKRRPNYTYTKINGRRIKGGHNERCCNLQDAYLAVEGTKYYAERCEELQPSVLDELKAKIEEAEAKLSELKTRYGNRLKAELEQAQRMIFNDAK